MAEENKDLLSKVKRKLFESFDWDTIKQYNDNFDVIDENDDTLENTTEELNRYYLSGHLNVIIDEEEILDDISLPDNEITDDDEDENSLSQKFSQLLMKNNQAETPASKTSQKRSRTSSLSSPPVITKKMKMNNYDDDDYDDNDTEQDQIPNYLSLNNQSFIHMTQTILKTVNSINMNDIQQIALIMHHKAAVHYRRELTKVYLLSVLGTLKEPECDLKEIDRRVWPIQVKSLMLTHCQSTTSTDISTTAMTTTTNTEMLSQEEHLSCENLLRQQLQEMKQQIIQYEQELDEKKNSLTEYTPDMENIIQIYAEHNGIQSLRLIYDFKVAMIKYNYESEILGRKYFHEKPNDYQIQIAKRLSDSKREFEKLKRELLELKQQVFYNKPSVLFDSIQLSISTSNDKKQSRLLNENELLSSYKKLDMMALYIREAEFNSYPYQKIFDAELSKMWTNHRDLVKDKDMPTTLTNLIEQRLNIIADRSKDIYNYKIKYCLQNSYDIFNQTMTNGNDQSTQTIGFLSNIIITSSKHQLTNKQLQLLNRGPTYVPPCQMYVSSSYQSMDEIIKKQYAPFKHQLNSLFSKYHINIALTMEIQKKLYDQFKHHFFVSIPSHLKQRALYEKKLIQSIRTSLNKNNLILRRTADNMNTFYVGNRHDFDKLADKYMVRSDAYKVLISKADEGSNNQQIQNDMKEMIDSMNILLEDLRKHKSLDYDAINKLLIDTNKVKLPYLYFLPDISKENELSLVPFITSQQSATWKISQFLNQLLRPFVNKTLQSTTFYDEIDFIEKLNHYVHTERRLRPKTIFCSIKITNFYTLDTHSNMIDTVDYFLKDHLATSKLENIHISTIHNLLHLFLYNNVFNYDAQIYTFTKGSPNTMELTETLSNIYLFAWQKQILKHVREDNELFGRYKDQIFFTCNKSNALELETFIQEIREKHRNVRVQKTIGSNVHYLNAYIENRHGQLYTRVDHQLSSIQRYRLPYVMGHSKLAYSDWLRSALIRAVCYCSSVEDFHQERLYLELTYLVNGYSVLFVETRVQHFFDYFHMANMRYSANQMMYDKFRRQWFDYMNMQHDLSQKLQKFDDHDRLINFNYIYEYGPRCRFNQQFHQLWSYYFSKHPSLSKETSKILLTTKHYHSLHTLLAQHKPTSINQTKT